MLTTEEIRKVLVDAGVHMYADVGDVIYVGNGYVGIHAATVGKKTIMLPTECRITPIFGSDFCGDAVSCITLELDKFETVLFRMSEIEK